MLMLIKVCVTPGSYGCYHRWWSHFPSMTRAFTSTLGLISSMPSFFLLLHNHFSFLCLIDSIITQTCCFTFHLYEPRQSKRASREQLDKTPSGPHPQHCLALFSPVLEQGEETPPGNHLPFTSPHSLLTWTQPLSKTAVTTLPVVAASCGQFSSSSLPVMSPPLPHFQTPHSPALF